MASDDHYSTLRVAADADGGTIRSAYRELMRRYHPDVNASRGASAKAKSINEAYACLRDPSKRASYDRDRAAGTRPAPRRRPPPPPPPMSDWVVADAGGWRRPRLGRPTWWQMLGFGGATVATAITFTATSATPSPGVPVAGPIYVKRLETVHPGSPQPGHVRSTARPKQTTGGSG